MTHKLFPKNSDPGWLKFFKWGGIVAGGVMAMSALGGTLVTMAVKWAAEPIIHQAEERGLRRDSLIVSRLQAMDEKFNALSRGLGAGTETRTGKAWLRYGLNIQPTPVELPEDSKPEKKKGDL